jgi:hypothetical protein
LYALNDQGFAGFEIFSSDKVQAAGEEDEARDVSEALEWVIKDQKERIVRAWEDRGSKIKELFDNYLFPIVKWSNKESLYCIYELPKQSWGIFRGMPCEDQRKYDYEAVVSENNFQICSPYKEGEQFFDYVFRYLLLTAPFDKSDEKLKSEKGREAEKERIYPYVLSIDGEQKKTVIDFYSEAKLERVNRLYRALQLAFVDRFKHLPKRDTDELIAALDANKDDGECRLTKNEAEKIFFYSFYYRFICGSVTFNGINAYVLGKSNKIQGVKNPHLNPPVYPLVNPSVKPFYVLLKSRTPADFFSRLGEPDTENPTVLDRDGNEIFELSENEKFLENPKDYQND